MKKAFQQSVCIECMYTELPFSARFAAAKRDGFAYVEFWGWEDKDLETVKRVSLEAGIGISGFNGDALYSLVDPSHREPYLNALRKSVTAAQEVGALSLTIHSNALGKEGRVIKDYAELSKTVKLCSMYDTLAECAEIAENSGLQLNLEALNIIADHQGNFLQHTRDAAEMTRRIGSPRLKILYDAYHMQLNEGNLCGNIGDHIDQIGHVHVADAPGRHEPGTGEINYATVFTHLKQSGYCGLIGYELYPQTTTAEAVNAIQNYQN